MNKLITLIGCILAGHSIAQNLVPNGSFEQHDVCPTYYGQIGWASPWNTPSYGSPDYYHPCADSASMVSVPYNWTGYQPPQDGEAYAGISIYYDSPSNVREYLGVQLTAPLAADQCYSFRMHVNVPNSSHYSSNSIGVYFSGTVYPTQTSDTTIHLTPQMNNQATAFPDTVSWMEISGEFLASGGEEFLLIGNFNDSASTHLRVSNADEQLFFGAYLLIDNVSLVPCEVESVGSLQEKQVTVSPNPCSDYITFTGLDEVADLYIFDHSGRIILVLKVNGSQPLAVDRLRKGSYFYTLKTTAGEMKGKLIKE